jgi:hypothetical protein
VKKIIAHPRVSAPQLCASLAVAAPLPDRFESTTSVSPISQGR